MASRKFLVPANLLNLAEDPASGTSGDIYFNTTSDKLKIYDGTTWVEVGGGAGGGSTITVSETAPVSPNTGDAWYQNTTGSFYVYDGSFWVEVNGVVASESFKTISVSGQSDIVADGVTDTLTFIAGTNVSIETNATNDSITINSTGDYTSVDSITYPDYITFDTTPETIPTAPGSLFWDSGDGLPATVLNANVSIGLGQEQVALVKNATGSSIAKGKVVYISGAQGQRPTITLSDADTETTSSKTFGVTAEAIADGAEGFVTTFGVLRDLNTDGLTEGAPIWLSTTAGNFTTSVPEEPAHSVFIGYVVKAHPSSGEIFVNIQNGYELTELHGVLIDGTPANNEVLAYDDFSGLWINQTAPEAGLIDTSATEQTKAGNLIIGGNLTVNGTTTTLNTENLNVEDNIITLNSGVTGTPSLNSGIEVERGTSDNVSVLWNETSDEWTLTNDGITSYPIATQNGYTYDNVVTIRSYDGITDGAINLQTYLNTFEISDDSGVVITTGEGTKTFSFNNSGNVSFPGNISFTDASVQSTAFLGISSYDTDDVSEGVTNLYFTDQRAIDALSTTLGNYLTEVDAATTYLTQIDASSTYQPIGSYIETETDPIFTASEAFNITSTDTTNWDSAYSWGDHSLAGYSLDTHNHTVDSLSNVVITGTPTDGQALVWDTTTSKWINETVVQDLSSYLTISSAASTYQPIGSYLTSESDTLSSVTGRGATTSDAITITNSTASSSTTTGALVVTGGVGIGEDLYVNNDVYVGGNINITGSITGDLTSVDVTNLVVTDPLIYLAEGNPDDSVDIGIFAALNHGGPSYSHAGLIRDASDSGKWKLASGLSDPTSNVIDFTSATFDTLKLGTLEATSVPTVGTITSGTWNGTVIGYAYGGTGLTTLGTAGQALKVNATADGLEWGTVSGGGGSSAAAVTSDPPSSPELNQVWQDLDTGRIYVWDGDFWIEVQQNGSLGLLRYLGASATAPTLSIDGSDLQVGEVYFDTVFNGMKVYDGTGWEDAFSAASLNVSRWVYTAVGGETSLTGNDDNSVALAYTAGIEEVYLNGVKLIRTSDYIATNGTSITNLEPLVAGSIVEVISYSGFTVANTYTKIEVDDLIQKQGVRWTKVAGAGTSISTLSGSDDYSVTLTYTVGTESVYVNGVLLVRGVDYTASNGSSIVLNEALVPGDVVEVLANNSFSVANVYTKSEIDGKLEEFMTVALSDEISTITTGTAKVTLRAPYAMTLTQIPRASLNTASTSGTPTVDINKNGTSILGTDKLSIDANEKTSVTATTATNLSSTSFADDDEITFDIDVAGTGAKGLKVVIYYKRA